MSAQNGPKVRGKNRLNGKEVPQESARKLNKGSLAMPINPIIVLAVINLAAVLALLLHRRQLEIKRRRRQTITIDDKRRGEILMVLAFTALFALTVGVVIAATHQL